MAKPTIQVCSKYAAAVFYVVGRV